MVPPNVHIPEQTNRKTQGSDKGRHETLLRRDVPVGTVKLAAPVVPVPGADSEVPDKRADEEGDEGKLTDSQGESVHLDVDKGESLEPSVEHGVDETLRSVFRSATHGFESRRNRYSR